MTDQPATCSHGRVGFCHDEATPEQRTAFDESHAFAYSWAIERGKLERDDAEAFAGWYAQRAYDLPIEDWGWMPREFEDYERELGRRPPLVVHKPAPMARRRRGRAA
jgi:hypothetical protein